MDKENISDFNLILESLEQRTYYRNSHSTVREVINKVVEFSNFLNSNGRLALLNANLEESQELVGLFLLLKKDIRHAESELGQSRTRKIHNFICPECDNIIQVPPNYDTWTYLQQHEHFENFYSKFLDGTLRTSKIPHNATSDVYSGPSTSKIDVNQPIGTLDTEHTDSGIDYEDGLIESYSPEEEEPLGSNTFRFNFKPRYDPVVEAAIYPISIRSLTKYDNCKYLTIKKVSPFKVSCLLCCCDLLMHRRISKNQCLEHVIGQRHIKASEDALQLAALENYHELFWNMEPCYQAHQVYCEPKTQSSVRCNLCTVNVLNKNIIQHIHGEPHMSIVIKMFTKKSVDYLLLNVQVLAYGIDPEKIANEQSNNATPEKKPRERRERRSSSNNSKSDTEIKHNIVLSLPKHPGNALCDIIPHRFQDHLQCFQDNTTHVTCRACKRNIMKKPGELFKHIISNQHQQFSKIKMPRYTYFCEICKLKLNDEYAWEKHYQTAKNWHSKIPKSRIDNVTEFECITCKTIIYGDEVISLTRHRNRAGGKREKPKDTQLPKETIRLFVTREAIEKEGEWLTREANNAVICLQKTMECCNRLEAVLATTLETCKAYPFGSRVSGLGNQDSDLDLFIDIGDMYYGKNNQDSLMQCQIVRRVAGILNGHKDEFTNIRQVPGARTPIVNVTHIATGLVCDLSFRHGLSVENTKFIRLCLELQPITQSFILILKKWSAFNRLQEHITTYALAMLAIFYLQVNKYLISVKRLRELNSSEIPVIGGWETLKLTASVESMKEEIKEYEHSVVNLLKDFFQFYATFDYDYVVCPLLGLPIKRSLFHDTRLLPKDMIAYLKQLRSKEPEQFRYNSPFCIQDPFDLSHNLTKALQGNVLGQFKKLCELSYKHLNMIR